MIQSCEHATTPGLGAYVDGELSGTERTWWERHLRGCEECREQVRRLRALGTALRQSLPMIEPSAALREAVRRAARTPESARVIPLPSRPRLIRWPAALAAIAALLLLGVGFGLGRVAGSVAGTRGDSGGVIDEVVAAHVRSLQVDHLVDVASSAHHVVKPWFAGKLDFSPPVPDLAASGFPMLGGRTEYLDGRAAAGLVYARGPHRINLFVWPMAGAGGCRREPPRVRQGFNVVRGEVPGMELWAISDLNADELRTFVDEWLRAATGGQGGCRAG